jgi:predicted ATP-dependent endonuclease of OLD family
MIRIEKIHIHEFRGIRDLTLQLEGKNFAACGPNGTGKSGIVDAIEFALTGNISRLSGSGTGGLTVKQHGPHVDSRDKPEQAFVELEVSIPALKGKKATIKRVVKNAGTPNISPADKDVLDVCEMVALHPEFVLSRREIIQYVLSEPGKRSKEVQALLRLDDIEFQPKLKLFRKRDVLERRDAGEPMREIARSYNISHSTISSLTG